MIIEQNSDTWKTVKAWAEKQLADAMVRLKSASTGEADTNHARGVVNTIETLLDLAKPKPPGPTPRDTKYL